MEKFHVELSPVNGCVEVIIKRKNIKNVHLKVFRDLSVVLSLPIGVTDEWIETFIIDKVKWIDTQITKYKQSSGYNNLTNIKSGSSTQMLGKDMRIYKKLDSSNYIELDEKCIIVYLKDVNSTELFQSVFEKWWRDKANQVFQNEIDFLYNKIFKKYDIDKPTLTIKKMKTLWGSCTKAKNKITLNEYLLKADIRCIQYVVLHELTHMLYSYHNTDFYNFLTIQMPDWKERKNQLDKEVVQGL